MHETIDEGLRVALHERLRKRERRLTVLSLNAERSQDPSPMPVVASAPRSSIRFNCTFITRAVCSPAPNTGSSRTDYLRRAKALVKHPGILTAAALRRIHHQRSLSQCDPRQSAGNDGNLVAEQRIWTKINMPRLNRSVGDARRADSSTVG